MALVSTQPLVKMSTRNFPWGKGGRYVWLTTYHPCSAETSRKSGVLNLGHLGLSRENFTLVYLTCHTELCISQISLIRMNKGP